MQQVIEFPRARRSDPVTSKRAAEKLDATRITSLVYLALCRFPGCTASELAEKARLPKEPTRKRLSELRQKGLAKNGMEKICPVSGFSCLTWFPVMAEAA